MRKFVGLTLLLFSMVIAVHAYSSSSVTSSMSVAIVDSEDALLAYDTHPTTLIAGPVMSETLPIALHNRLPNDVEILSLDVTSHPHLEAHLVSPTEVPASERTAITVVYDGLVRGGSYPVTHRMAATAGDVQIELTIDVPFIVLNRLEVYAAPEAGGTVTGAGLYEHQTDARVEAIATTCYRLQGWEGDVPIGAEADTPLTVHMDANKSIRALFAKQRYLVSVEATEGGSTEPAQDGTYECGTEVTISAHPDDGYQFVGWSGSLTGSDTPTTVRVDEDMRITAKFAPLSGD